MSRRQNSRKVQKEEKASESAAPAYNNKKEPQQMGFIRYEAKPVESREALEEEIALRYDNGAILTWRDLRHHLFVSGSTGSGKTWCVALPVLNKAMEMDLPMLISDIKGSMGGIIRAQAAKYGLEDKVEEYGNCAKARRINWIRDMDRDEFSEFLENTTLFLYHGDPENWIWVMKGILMVVDIFVLLNFMADKLGEEFRPNLQMLGEMIENHEDTRQIYKVFKELVYDETNKEHRRLVKSIKTNQFHILAMPYGEAWSGNKLEEYERQLTWNLQGVRVFFKRFMDTPGLAENFAAPDGRGLDIGAAPHPVGGHRPPNPH